MELLERGYYLSMDAFAWLQGRDFQDAIDRIVDLCRRGWSHRLMLGHDYIAYNGWLRIQPVREISGWCRIPLEVAPAPERAGIGSEDLENLCHRTARTMFGL